MIHNKKIFSIILSMLIILALFWHYIIRQRLPRIIPYPLTELSFLLLSSTCIILFIIILLCTRGIELKPNCFTLFLGKSLDLLYIFLTKEAITANLFLRSQQYIVNVLFKYKTLIGDLFMGMFCLRIFMLTIFCTEVFYYKEIKLFYILFGIFVLPIIFNSFIYTVNSFYNNNMLFIEERVNIHCLYKKEDYANFIDFASNYKIITAEEWLNQVVLKELNLIDYDFEIDLYLQEKFLEEYYGHMTLKELAHNKNFLAIKPNVFDVAKYNTRIGCIMYFLSLQKTKRYFLLNLIVIITYFIAWVYILLKSIHTLENIPMILLFIKNMTTYTTVINPFSNP